MMLYRQYIHTWGLVVHAWIRHSVGLVMEVILQNIKHTRESVFLIICYLPTSSEVLGELVLHISFLRYYV